MYQMEIDGCKYLYEEDIDKKSDRFLWFVCISDGVSVMQASFVRQNNKHGIRF